MSNKDWEDGYEMGYKIGLKEAQAEIDSLRKNLDVALMIVNKPELTDEEITATWYEPTLRYDPVAFARAILLKANDK